MNYKDLIDILSKYKKTTNEIDALIVHFPPKEGSYLPSNRNSPKSDRVENAPLAILISTEQFNFME